MRVGVTLMHWRHDKDLGGYSLGQGGYYSPQRYTSVGVPVSYAWRNYDWSLLLEGSVGWSQAHSGSSRLYPDAHVNHKVLAQYGVDSNLDAISDASNSSGLGYRLRGLFERRLSDHWVMGGGFDWQHSDDYAPSHRVAGQSGAAGDAAGALQRLALTGPSKGRSAVLCPPPAAHRAALPPGLARCPRTPGSEQATAPVAGRPLEG